MSAQNTVGCRRGVSFWNQVTGQNSIRSRRPVASQESRDGGGGVNARGFGASSSGGTTGAQPPRWETTGPLSAGTPVGQPAIAQPGERTELSREVSSPSARDVIGVGREAYRQTNRMIDQWSTNANDALGDPSGWIQSAGQGASRLVQGFGDFVGDVVGTVVSAPAMGADGATGLARLGARGLEMMGAPEAAQRLRSAADTASSLLEPLVQPSREMGRQAENLFGGLGDGLGGAFETVGTVLANPISTVRGLGELAFSPTIETGLSLAEGRGLSESFSRGGAPISAIVDGIAEQYRRTGEDHGTVGQLARGAFDVFSVLGTGGTGAAGRLAGRMGARTTAGVLDDVARVNGRVQDTLGRVVPGTGNGVADVVLGSISEDITNEEIGS